jgi:hypothetical protein
LPLWPCGQKRSVTPVGLWILGILWIGLPVSTYAGKPQSDHGKSAEQVRKEPLSDRGRYGANDWISQPKNQQILKDLSEHAQWHKLLHYRFHPFSFSTKSENDAEVFFLSPGGKTDLTATLRAFLTQDQYPDQSPQCRFPARYQWLKEQLPNLDFEEHACPELQDWMDELNAEALTLVFPAAHINSPSSMYGHTLVRLDRLDPDENELLAYAVNFAADHDPEDNELVFSYKGLTGGYPGRASIMPFYIKSRDYQHMEYRNIWEYRLDFTQDEVDQFVRHIWELRDTFFDYYFFDENCAYQIVTLLDAASERSNIANRFSLTAVPVDTIREMYRQDLVDNESFRPSSATQMKHLTKNASTLAVSVAKQLVDSDIEIGLALSELNTTEKIQALEIAHEYARYLAVKKKQSNPLLRQRNLAILSARSRLPSSDQFDDPYFTEEIQAPYRDDQGHGTHRLTLGRGWAYSGASPNQSYQQLVWRPAYHEMMDPPEGFAPGSQIEMGEIEFRYWQQADDHQRQALQLHSFSAVEVLSMTDRGDFIRPLSWGIRFGLERFQQDGADLFGLLEGRFGRTWSMLDTSTSTGVTSPQSGGQGIRKLSLYSLMVTSLQADDQFDGFHRIGVGGELGVMAGSGAWQGRANMLWQPSGLGDERLFRELYLEVGHHWQRRWQIRVRSARQLLDDIGVNEHQLSLNWYY